MALFLWYSKSSQETGEWLAKRLGISEHGTRPPREFEGSVICWGANPSQKFKWEKRNFQAIYNDPRVIRPLIDRKALFEKITGIGPAVVKFTDIPEENPQYSAICTQLEVSEEEGFLACTPGGFKRVSITCQGDLDDATGGEDGRTRATVRKFTTEERLRIYVANGSVVGGSKYTTSMPAETMASTLANKISVGWEKYTTEQCKEVLARAVDQKLITTKGGCWAPYAIADAALRTHAQAIATTLKFDFCAIDFSSDGTVLNIITTPNLREVTTVQTAITNAVASWIYKNTRTPKDILLEVIAESTGEEVNALLEELSSLKGVVRLTLKKEGTGKADEVAGGTDSPPAKSAQ
jgi:hypothetical protein